MIFVTCPSILPLIAHYTSINIERENETVMFILHRENVTVGNISLDYGSNISYNGLQMRSTLLGNSAVGCCVVVDVDSHRIYVGTSTTDIDPKLCNEIAEFVHSVVNGVYYINDVAKNTFLDFIRSGGVNRTKIVLTLDVNPITYLCDYCAGGIISKQISLLTFFTKTEYRFTGGATIVHNKKCDKCDTPSEPTVPVRAYDTEKIIVQSRKGEGE